MVEARRSPNLAREALAKRRAEADARAKDEIAILRASAAKARHEAAASALQRVLLRGMRFAFDRLADLLQPQPWALDADGSLLGHLLTVDDAVFERVLPSCDVEVLTMPEAFDRTWASLEQRTLWADAYVESLRVLADSEEQKDRAVRQHEDLSQRLPGVVAVSDELAQPGAVDESVCRLCGKPAHPGTPCRM